MAGLRTGWALALFAAGTLYAEEAPQPVKPADPEPPRATIVPAGGDVDMIGDKDGAPAKQSQALLDELKPDGMINLKARRAYALIGEMKTNIEKISTELDRGGKAITQLESMANSLSENITETAELWPENKELLNHCITAKRQTLLLAEELSRVPRVWKQLRWTMNSSLQAVAKLRHKTREAADAEPRPVATVGKDGKTVYVESAPVVDPVVAKRESDLRQARQAREILLKQEEERKSKKDKLRTDLDDK